MFTSSAWAHEPVRARELTRANSSCAHQGSGREPPSSFAPRAAVACAWVQVVGGRIRWGPTDRHRLCLPVSARRERTPRGRRAIGGRVRLVV